MVTIYDLLLASILGICGSDASVAYPFPYIGPHFDLFRYLFHLKPQPSKKEIAIVGGAGLQLHQGMDKVYIPYKMSGKVIDWKSK